MRTHETRPENADIRPLIEIELFQANVILRKQVSYLLPNCHGCLLQANENSVPYERPHSLCCMNINEN